MKRFATLLSLLVIVSGIVFALPRIPRQPAKSSIVQEGGYSSGNDVWVEALTENVIRVTYVPRGEQPGAPKLLLDINKHPECQVISTDRAKTLVTTSGLVATVNYEKVTITAEGKNTITCEKSPEIIDGKQVITLNLMHDCPVYGAGERGHSLNLFGDTLVMFNRQNYGYVEGDPRISQMGITMPLLISKDGFAIVFDDYAAASLYAGNPLVYSSENLEPISFYIICPPGPNVSIAETVIYLSEFTGRQQMPPLWSLGYITSKYGYRTQKETLGVIDTLQRKGYPVDGIVLDLYWYGKEQDMGRLEWEKSAWPNHKKMLEQLKKKGVNLVAISQPYVLKNGKAIDNYNELSAKGMFAKDSLGNTHDVKIWVGEGGMFDVSNPDTYEWLYNRYKLLTEEGVTGWWGDLGEPEVHPESIFHHNGLSARLYHNVYGNDWSKIISDLFSKEYPGTRLMTMMRGGTIGLQKYNVFPWSTDVSRSWGGMQPQVKIMLNSGLSGLGYMSHDVSGFAIDHNNPVDPELYVRWLQLGVFSPILRTHAQQVAEPYKYPEQQDIILDLVKARYRWLPYNYTLAYENALSGLPLVRPLNFYGNDDESYENITDQYFWGKDIMVAPVLEKGVESRKIIFPAGAWYDMNDPSRVYTESEIDYPVDLATIPLFVRAGSFIPMAEYKMKNTGDYRTDNYTIHYYPGDMLSGAGNIYEDDLVTPSDFGAANANPYNIIRLTDNLGMITVRTYMINGGIESEKTLTFVIHAQDREQSVKIGGTPVKTVYDAENKTLTFTVNYSTTDELDIEFSM